MSLGAALVLEQDLATSRHMEAVLVTSDTGAYQRGAAKILRTTIQIYNERIEAHLSLTDLATQRVLSSENVRVSSSGGVLGAVNLVAKRIDPQAASFSTKSEQAWRAYTAAAASSNLQARVQMLHAAVNADPSFGLAYLVLAQVLSQAGDHDLAPLLSAAASHEASFTVLDQARFSALAARLSGAPLAQQANASNAVLKLAPNDVDALATLGSESFLRNNGAEGERLLKRAIDLNPTDVNIRAELAQGLVEARRFSEAEKTFTGIDNHAVFLPQLAVCILLEGDPGRANATYANYLQDRAAANDPLLFLAQANWLAVSKTPADGVQYLARNNFSQGDLRSLAYSQSSIWRLMSKDTGGAKKDAALAPALAKAPVAQYFATIATLMASSDEPAAEWREQVNASALNASSKRVVLAYGLFVNGRYPEAAAEWQALARQSGDADLRARAMLAASLDRAGRSGDAQKIAVQPFLPNLTGADQFAVLPFEEMRRLLKQH